MSWAEIAKAAAALLVDLGRDWLKERDAKRAQAQAWTYQDVKRVNDFSHRAGHETEPGVTKRDR